MLHVMNVLDAYHPFQVLIGYNVCELETSVIQPSVPYAAMSHINRIKSSY